MIGFLIELMVSALLATTIGYCIMLDRRLRRLKADEDLMRRTIAELVVATERAERAVAGLRGIVNDCDQTITEHLRHAERSAADLAGHIRSGDDVIARIAKIVESARGGSAPAPAPVAPAAPVASPAPERPPMPEAPASPGTRLASTLAAAQAFAERASRRVNGQAA